MITIVACHFRLPEKRLRDFIRWNREVFDSVPDLSVLIVSDREWPDLPAWVQVKVYPGEMEIYSPSKASNYGIRQAGQGIICKTDIDCAFSFDAIEHVRSIQEGEGVAFVYRMAQSYETRHESRPWGSSKGTMALVFEDWDRTHGYDERQSGYGLEDGDGYCRARGFAKVKRPPVDFWHIAHEEGAGKEQIGAQQRRTDYWNRESGFCPYHYAHNKKARRSGPWVDENWGRPELCKS